MKLDRNSVKLHLGAALKHPRIIRLVTVAWLLLMILGSLQPARPPLLGYSSFHLGIHWVAFAGAAFLLLLMCSDRVQEVLGVSALCLLGISLEYFQHLIYHIPIEWRDVRNDWLAIFVAFALYRLAGVHAMSQVQDR